MLQTHQAIGARALDTPPALDTGATGPAPDHVDPLLWKLAGPAEREALSHAGRPAQAEMAEAGPARQAATAWPSSQPAPLAAPKSDATRGPASERPSASGTEQALIVKVTDQFRARFSEAAQDPVKFNDLLSKSFGATHDKAAAEGLRQQALRNDFGWMPKVEVVSQAQLADVSGTQGDGVALGAYSQSTDTVFISRELLASDPAKAERILCEEVGHALDARLNTADTVGDEGDVFSALLHGDSVSDAQLKAMRADNDRGVIHVNGQRVEVEYGILSKVKKAVSGAVKSVGNFVEKTAKAVTNVAVGVATLDMDRVKDGLKGGVDAAKQLGKDAVNHVKETWKDIKADFTKLMQSKVFNAILMVARFIPIPVVQLVVRVVDLVKAAYSVYQGVKHKSFGAVLGGVAGLAGGAANFGNAIGLSASTVGTLQAVATTARTASTAYNVVANKDFSGAALLAAQALGAPAGVTDTLKTVNTVDRIVKAAENKDYAGVLTGAAGLVAGQTGKAMGISDETARTVVGMAHNAAQVQRVVKAVENNDFVGAGVIASNLLNLPADMKTTLQTMQGLQQLSIAIDKNNDAAAVKAGASVLQLKEQAFNGLDQSTAPGPAKPPAPVKSLVDVWSDWAAARQAKP